MSGPPRRQRAGGADEPHGGTPAAGGERGAGEHLASPCAADREGERAAGEHTAAPGQAHAQLGRHVERRRPCPGRQAARAMGGGKLKALHAIVVGVGDIDAAGAVHCQRGRL